MSRPDDDVLGTFDAAPFRAEWTADGHVHEETIHAWLDGALSDSDSDAVAQHAEACGTCSALIAEARGLIAASVRIMHEADVSPRNVVPQHDVMRTAARVAHAGARPRASAMTRIRTRTVAQVAAGLLVMVAGAAYVASRDDNAGALSDSTRAVAIATPAPDELNSATPDPAALPPQPVSQRADSVVPQARALARQRTNVAVADAPPPATADSVVAPPVESSVAEVAAIAPSVISGRVIAGAAPLPMATVVVSGTSISTTTDSLGRYTLRNVPATATTLLARHIGYDPGTKSLPITASDTASVDIELKAAEMRLSQMVVTAERVPVSVRNLRCLVSVNDSLADRAPLVRMLRGTLRSAGTHTLALVGWPAAGEQTNARFVLDSDGTLSGSASANGATIVFDLQAGDESWFGTVSETRGVVTRQEDVEFVAVTSAQRCARNE